SVWYHAPLNDPSYNRQRVLLLSNSMQSALLQAGGRANYGIYEANFAVLRASAMPAVLVETAFLSNNQEAALLANDGFRQQLAVGIVNGLTDYFHAI
ncbi:MAG: N-acetylmuramoyl-L-alanine amidase, partial [Clostridiales bacterium]